MSPGVVAKDLIRPSHEHDARNRRDYESRIGALQRSGFFACLSACDSGQSTGSLEVVNATPTPSYGSRLVNVLMWSGCLSE